MCLNIVSAIYASPTVSLKSVRTLTDDIKPLPEPRGDGSFGNRAGSYRGSVPGHCFQVNLTVLRLKFVLTPVVREKLLRDFAWCPWQTIEDGVDIDNVCFLIVGQLE